MVFESLVADYLDSFLGDYIDNLNTDNLNVGIWKGNVVLKDLFIKENALDFLNLPIKVHHGHIGYEYNHEKEEKFAQEKKQKKLKKFEEIKNKQTAANKKSPTSGFDTFREQLTTQIIKNLQVNVQDVHIRYEDSTTRPDRPFSVGMSLKNLKFETTDVNWKPTVIREMVTKIHKLITVDHFAVYWNSDCDMYSDLPRFHLIESCLKANIVSSENKTDYNYIIEPLSTSTQMVLNTKPGETEYTLPKFMFNIVLQHLTVNISKTQYRDLMELLVAMERMKVSLIYRKYRRQIPLKGNAKERWHFAYTCVVEENIRRHRRMWSWENIYSHRQLYRQYKDVYRKKISNKKAPSDIQKAAEFCEKQLNVFNIVLCRQEVEIEVRKAAYNLEQEEKMKRKKKRRTREQADSGNNVQDSMTEDEKIQFCRAMEHQDDIGSSHPAEYTSFKFFFKLENFDLIISDANKVNPTILEIGLRDLYAELGHRPTNKSYTFETRIGSLNVIGHEQDGTLPILISPYKQEEVKHTPVLSVKYETNPLVSLSDRLLNIEAQPLEIVYDAMTCRELIRFFHHPGCENLKRLQMAALARFEEKQRKKTMSLKHAIHQHKHTEVHLHLHPSYIVIPADGLYKQDTAAVVFDLGDIHVNSEERNNNHTAANEINGNQSVDDLQHLAYEKYNLNVKNIQVLFSQADDNWQSARKLEDSPLHVIKPFSVQMVVQRCISAQLTKLPRNKVQIELPDVHVEMLDQQLSRLLTLLQNLPIPRLKSMSVNTAQNQELTAYQLHHVHKEDSLPDGLLYIDSLKQSYSRQNSDIESTCSADVVSDVMSSRSEGVVSDVMSSDHFESSSSCESDSGQSEQSQDMDVRSEVTITSSHSREEMDSDWFLDSEMQAVDLQLEFEMKQLCVTVTQRRMDTDVPTLQTTLESLQAEAVLKPLDASIQASLGNLAINFIQDEGPVIKLVSTAITDNTAKLVTMCYSQVNRDHPEFAQLHNYTEQKVTMHVGELRFHIHQAPMLDVLEIIYKSLPDPAIHQIIPDQQRTKQTSEAVVEFDDIIKLAMEIRFDLLDFSIVSGEEELLSAQVIGLETSFATTSVKSCLDVGFLEISVHDPNEESQYNQILFVNGGDEFSLSMDKYNYATAGEFYSDMSRVDSTFDLFVGSSRGVITSKFINRLLDYFSLFTIGLEQVEAKTTAVVHALAERNKISDAEPDKDETLQQNRSKRVAVKIQLRQPTLQIPQTNTATELLTLRPEMLTVTNSFQILVPGSAVKLPVVLNEITLQVEDLCIFRTSRDETKETLLIGPIFVDLELTQNLAYRWYRDQVKLDLSATVRVIPMYLTSEDIQLLLLTWLDNLSQITLPPREGVWSYPEIEPVEEVAVSRPKLHSITMGGLFKFLPESPQIFEEMKFQIRTIGVDAVFYAHRGIRGEAESRSHVRDTTNRLAQLQLKDMVVDGTVLCDSMIQAKLHLSHITLDDVRPGREAAVTRIMEKFSSGNSQANEQVADDSSMVDLTFLQIPEKDKAVSIQLKMVYLCVDLEYTLSLVNFIMNAVVPLLVNDFPPKVETVISVRIDSPEIFLLQDATDVNTRALTLTTDLEMKLQRTPKKRTLITHARELQMMSCIFAPDKREASQFTVLEPMDVHFDDFIRPDHGHSMKLKFSDLALSMSPDAFQILKNSLSTVILKQKFQEVQESFENIVELKNTEEIPLELTMDFKQIGVTIVERKDSFEIPILSVGVITESPGVKLQKYQHAVLVEAYVAVIAVQHLLSEDDKNATVLSLVNAFSENPTSSNQYSVRYVKVNQRNPEFSTTHKCVEQQLTLNLGVVTMSLTQIAMLDMLDLIQTIRHTMMSETEQDEPNIDDSGDNEVHLNGITQLLMDVTLSKLAVALCGKESTLTTAEMSVNLDFQNAVVSEVHLIPMKQLSTGKMLIAKHTLGLQSSLRITPSRTYTDVSLEDVILKDSTPYTRYPEILSLTEDVCRLSVIHYRNIPENEKANNMDLKDYKVKMYIGSGSFVFLKKFVDGLLDFTSVIKKDHKSESNIINEEGKGTKQDAEGETEGNLLRVVIDLRIKDPEILIPQSVYSQNAMLIQLGTVMVKNVFQRETQPLGELADEVIEKIKIEFPSFAVSRCVIDDEEDGAEKAQLITSTPLTFSVRCPVTPTADEAKMHVTASLPLIETSLSPADVRILIQLVRENLLSSPNKHKTEASIMSPEHSVKIVPILEPQASIASEMDSTQMKRSFEFTMEGFSFVFYTDEVMSDARRPLGRFEIDTVLVEGRNMADGSVVSQVTMSQCTLNDIQSSSDKVITRVIEQNKDSDAVNSMIDVSINHTFRGATHVEMQVVRPRVAMSVDYLMYVIEFFVAAIPPSPVTKLPSEPVLYIETEDGVKEPNDSSFRVKLLKPEIMLLQTNKDINTDAFLIDGEMSFSIWFTPLKESLMGSLHNLQIYSCVYSPELRHDSCIPVLSKTDIFVVNNIFLGQGQEVDVNVSDIDVTLTPRTVHVIKAMIEAAVPHKSVATQQKEEADLNNLWQAQDLSSSELWFLQSVPESNENTPGSSSTGSDMLEYRYERVMLHLGNIVVKLEADITGRALPVLLAEMTCRAEANDWSSKLSLGADLTIQIASYNESLAVWEPILEPMEESGLYRPWEFRIKISRIEEELMREDEISDTESQMSSSGYSESSILLPTPKMSIMIESEDFLQFTLTKTFLELFTRLKEIFKNPANQSPLPEAIRKRLDSPFAIQNNTGFPVLAKFDPLFQEPSDLQKHYDMFIIATDKCLKLFDKKANGSDTVLFKSINWKDQKRKILLKPEGFDQYVDLTVAKPECRLFPVRPSSAIEGFWSLVTEVEQSYGTKVITLRSVVQLHNHMPQGMEIYYQLGEDSMGLCGELHPGAVLDLPMRAVHSEDPCIYFKPMVAGYHEMSNGVFWESVAKDDITVVTCQATDPNLRTFYFHVNVEVEKICTANSTNKKSLMYKVHLNSAIILRNLLPYTIQYTLLDTGIQNEIEKGGKESLLNACIGKTAIKIVLMDYMGKSWIGSYAFDKNPEQWNVLTFVAQEDGFKNSLNLGLHIVIDKGCMDVALYARYWMVNKTELQLEYMATDDSQCIHPGEMEDPVLFSFNSKAFFSKNKASLKVKDSEWSEKCSLDTIGSSGIVTCRGPDQSFEIGGKIHLASHGLTKIVVLTPFFLIVNQCKFDITCFERFDDPEYYHVPAGQCIPFWPKRNDKNLLMVAKVKEQYTSPFLFSEQHATFLKLDNEYGGMNVHVTVTTRSCVLNFQPYEQGMAAVHLVNHTSKHYIEYRQCENGKGWILGPGESIYYTWDNPLGVRVLAWSCGKNRDLRNDLVTDGIGEVFVYPVIVYWVSFLDNRQRVLLFTEDLAVATVAQQAGELERVDREVELSLPGVGLSLLNNRIGKEVAYVSINSSGVVWEERKRRRYKPLNNSTCETLENAYQKYTADFYKGSKVQARQKLGDNLEVDFETMMMYRPHRRGLRRNFENGVWGKYSTSQHQTQLHVKIQNLQLDNQLTGCIYQTVVCPTPVPKSIAASNVPKPFAEMSLILRKKENTNVLQFKYFKVLIQELTVKLDQGFVKALLALFVQEVSEEREVELFFKDFKHLTAPLGAKYLKIASGKQNYFDFFHFSPLKIHVSFSVDGSSGEEHFVPTKFGSKTINFFLQSIGVVFADMEDVVFKLGFFERRSAFYSRSQLMSDISSHYKNQALKQIYVILLGFDVLGNPVKVLRGVAKGIEDFFYEPYQGAIQGPEEFVIGLALGVKSLFGHAVGGAAGAVSRITGALGKGIASLTLDEVYQKKRKERLRKSATIGKGLVQGSKGLVLGLVDGVTGIVRKPIQGARKQGVEGFFKGVGKGMVGVVTRPVSGMIDFTSHSLHGVHRSVESVQEIMRLRPPRFLHSDGVVRPFSSYEAQGHSILLELDKGRFAVNDVYLAHAPTGKSGRHLLLLTDQHIIMVKRGEAYGHFDSEWHYTWPELRGPPLVIPKGLQILIKEKHRKFVSGKTSRILNLPDEKWAKWVVYKAQEVMPEED